MACVCSIIGRRNRLQMSLRYGLSKHCCRHQGKEILPTNQILRERKNSLPSAVVRITQMILEVCKDEKRNLTQIVE